MRHIISKLRAAQYICKKEIMNIDIQSLHFTLQPDLNNLILDKVNKLQHFQSGIISAHVVLKVEKSDTQENKTCEIKLEIPGNDLFSKKHGKTFEEATA